jgi:hypothetical protein
VPLVSFGQTGSMNASSGRLAASGGSGAGVAPGTR